MNDCALLYLHGLGSSGQSDTGRFLQQHFGERCALHCPSYRPQFYFESARQIDGWLEELRRTHQQVAVLGSSMGGWQALHASLRHPGLHWLLLNPALNPGDIQQGDSTDDHVDHQTGAPLEWPELIAENFPAVPVDALSPTHMRMLIGEADEVVPPGPTLEACARRGISHRVFPWGHRAELDQAFADEIAALLQRARNPD